MMQSDDRSESIKGIAERFSRPLIFAVLAEAGATLSMIETFRLASDCWGTAGFSEWVLSRRVLAFLLPVMTIGMEIALPRFVAMKPAGAASHFLAAASLLVLVTAIALVSALWIFDSAVAGILFGDPSRHYLLLPIALLAIGYACNTLLYGYLRGRMEIMLANLVHIAAFGVIPLMAFGVFHDSPAHTISMLGVMVAAIAAAALAWVLFGARPPIRQSIAAFPEMLSFGSSRAIAALLLMLLFLLPATLVANQQGIEPAGAVGFAVSVVTIVASAFGPLVLIMLPVASRMAATGKVAELRGEFLRLERLVLWSGAGVLAALLTGAPLISIVITGDRSPEMELAVRFAALAAGPFAYFICIRNVVDACTGKAVISWILLIALIVFAGAVVVTGMLELSPLIATMCSFVLAIWVLAAASAMAAHRLLRSGAP